MEFDKSKVYTPFNCDQVKVGSKGYFSDYKSRLVEYATTQNSLHYSTLESITIETDYPFKTDDNMFCYFYLVEEPKEKTKRPCTREELLEMLKKQGLPMLKDKTTGNIFTVICLSEDYVHVHSIYVSTKSEEFTYHESCERYTLLDGTELWVEE